MNDDHKKEYERLIEMVGSHQCAIICLIAFIRKRMEMEAQFWNGLRRSLEEVK